MTADDLITKIHRVDRVHAEALARIGLRTVKDLLLFIPNRYTDSRENLPISHAVIGASLTLYGRMESVKVARSFRGHVPMTTASLNDGNGKIKLIFFNHPKQSHRLKCISTGKLSFFFGNSPCVNVFLYVGDRKSVV